MDETSGKKKIAMGAALAVLVVIALLIKLGGRASVNMAAQMISRQNFLEGDITYQSLNAGRAGDVEIKGLVWKDPSGAVKAEVPLVTVSVNFFDVLRKGGGISSISSVVMNRPSFHGVYEEGKGLDLMNLVHFAKKSGSTGSDKEKKAYAPTRFRGLIEVKDGAMEMISNGKTVTLDKINAQAAFRQYPLLKGSATASKGNTDLILNITRDGDEAAVLGEVKNAAAADIMAMYPDLKHIQVTSGRAPTVNVRASKDSGGWHIDIDTKVQDMAGTVFSAPFTSGSAEFSASRDVADIRKMSLSLGDVALDINGKIKSGRGTPLPPSFDLAFTAPSVPLKALSRGMDIDEAAVSVSGTLKGTALDPLLKGTFSGDKLKAAPLALDNLKGSFAWNFGRLELAETTASCYGGKIDIAGYLGLADRKFDLALDGQDIDTAQLTDRIQGAKAVFSARITGEDRERSALGQGTFSAGRGTYVETPGAKGTEVREFEGQILQQNGVFSARDAQIKLGRDKYEALLSVSKDGKVEVRTGKKLASSLF